MKTLPMIKIGEREIKHGLPPYVIAEIGVNHEGSMDLAVELITQAKQAGADAVKFQTYKASKLASVNSPAYWDQTKENTKTQFALFSKYDNFEIEDYQKLAKVSEQLDIDFLSTPFDEDAVDFLDPLMKCYKIASADILNVPLLRKIASKKKPVILSTGASTEDEIQFSLNTLSNADCSDVALLHCILNYPTPDENAHLQMIEGLKTTWPDKIIGYSDHTMPDLMMTSISTAYALGALIIEKHFTHDKTLPGNDHYHAMDAQDLKNFVKNVKKIHPLLGDKIRKEPINEEKKSIANARRSIVLTNDLVAGSTLTSESITCKRPGTGICSSQWDKILGLKVRHAMKADDILQWSDISG